MHISLSSLYCLHSVIKLNLTDFNEPFCVCIGNGCGYFYFLFLMPMFMRYAWLVECMCMAHNAFGDSKQW